MRTSLGVLAWIVAGAFSFAGCGDDGAAPGDGDLDEVADADDVFSAACFYDYGKR